jgi:actin cytoskeleton-regulatory complex protein SLA1
VLRLHKVNGVIIEVPSEKMSFEDMRYVEKALSRGGSHSRKTDDDDDDEPLANRRKPQQPPTVSQKKAPPVDWFEFFLNAGCDVDDCTRYASSFDRDKIDESILLDISEGTLRTLGLREGDIIRVTKAIDTRRPKLPAAKASSSDVNLLSGDEAPSPARTTPSPGAPNLFTGPGGQLKNARRGRPTTSKSTSTGPGAVDLGGISSASEQIARSSTPLSTTPVAAAPTVTNNTTTITSPVQVPSRSNSAAAGFDDDAWTNRPSSTKPVAPTPPIMERVPSVPPIPGALLAAPIPSQPPRAPSAPAAQATPSTSAGTSGGLAKTTDADIFDQLARLTQLRVQNPGPVNAPKSAPIPSPSGPSPLPVGYNQGLGVGVGPSPSPLGQHLQPQQTGFIPPPAQSGPRGPFAPVPVNQGLLAPLVPTTTGFNGFMPTRPATSPSFLGTQPTGFAPIAPQLTGFQPSLGPQPTGFQPSLAPQPTGFQPSLAPQPTGFQPYLAPQPTGFQPSLAPQPTGFQPSLAPQPTGFGGGSPFGGVPPVPPLPSSFQNGSFSQLQPRQSLFFFIFRIILLSFHFGYATLRLPLIRLPACLCRAHRIQPRLWTIAVR